MTYLNRTDQYLRLRRLNWIAYDRQLGCYDLMMIDIQHLRTYFAIAGHGGL